MQLKAYVLRIVVAYFSISIRLCMPSLILEHDREGLTQIPVDLNETVTDLRLQYNNITRIESYSLYNYTSLVRFNVACNNISYIHEVAFVWTPKLYYLKVSNNNLLSPGPWMKALVPSLLRLHIENTTFHAISQLESFNLTSLKRLSVSDNRMYSPEVTPLGGHLKELCMCNCDAYNIIGLVYLQKLKELKVRENNLITLPDLFNKSLKRLHLAENPWHCDFRLCWVRMWTLAKSSDLNLDKPVCDSPPDLSGIALMDVHPCDMDCHAGKRAFHITGPPVTNRDELNQHWD